MRSVFFAALLVLLGALLAGLVPPQALAAHPEPVTLVAAGGGHAPDALLSTASARPLPSPTARWVLSAAGSGQPALRPASRADLPSAVRAAHRVDGLSLPLLR